MARMTTEERILGVIRRLGNMLRYEDNKTTISTTPSYQDGVAWALRIAIAEVKTLLPKRKVKK